MISKMYTNNTSQERLKKFRMSFEMRCPYGKVEWTCCPVCGNKTRLQSRQACEKSQFAGSLSVPKYEAVSINALPCLSVAALNMRQLTLKSACAGEKSSTTFYTIQKPRKV